MGLINQIGGVLGGLAAIPSTIMQNAAQKKMQQREFDYNTQMWENANHYNSPEMQMARLKDAGLNPNLVYGNGSVTGNTSTQTPKYQAPQIQRLPLEEANPLAILGQFLDLRTKSAQANLVDENVKQQKISNAYLDTKFAQEQGLRYISGQKGFFDIGIGNAEVKNSPYSRKYSADVLNVENKNRLQALELDFFKMIPKQYQWAIPLLKGLFIGR